MFGGGSLWSGAGKPRRPLLGCAFLFWPNCLPIITSQLVWFGSRMILGICFNHDGFLSMLRDHGVPSTRDLSDLADVDVFPSHDDNMFSIP